MLYTDGLLPEPKEKRSYTKFFTGETELWDKPGSPVQLFVVLNNGKLLQYSEVMVSIEKVMPSRGQLTNAADVEAITMLEDTIIKAYGHAIVRRAFRAMDGGAVDIPSKIIRPIHVPTLAEELEATRAASLNLTGNQLGIAGGRALAGVLCSNDSLTKLVLAHNHMGSGGGQAVAEALKKNTSLMHLSLRACKLEPEDGKAVAEALKLNSTLTELDIGYNLLDEETVDMLRDAVKGRDAFTFLDLDTQVKKKES